MSPALMAIAYCVCGFLAGYATAKIITWFRSVMQRARLMRARGASGRCGVCDRPVKDYAACPMGLARNCPAFGKG